MVSFSSGSLSGEASNKWPLENGHVPKYQPRKVSAFREFPPECGPSVPKKLKHEQNGFCEAGIMDTVGVVVLEMTNTVLDNGAGDADLMEAQVVGISEVPKGKLNEIKDFEIQNVVGSNDIKNSKAEVDRQPHEAVKDAINVGVTKSLDATVEEVTGNASIADQLVMEIGPLAIQFPDKVGSHGHEAVDNPVEMERDQLLDSYVGKVTSTMMNGFSNEVEGLIPEIDLVGVNTPVDMKNVAESGDQTKDKYRPRRVSAIRGFPPHCGMHVSSPVEEKKMVVSGNDCPNQTGKVELAPECAPRRNDSEWWTAEVLLTSQKECLDGLQNIVRNRTAEMSNDGDGRGQLAETAEERLMDFGKCNRYLQPRIDERTEASPRSVTIFEDVIDSIKDTGRPVGKVIAVQSPCRSNRDGPQHDGFSFGNDSNRGIHGLMAAPYCQWKKSKAALKKSDGGTSGLEMQQHNLSETQNAKAIVLNDTLGANCPGEPSLENAAIPGAAESPGSLTTMDEGDHGTYDEGALEVTPFSMFRDVLDDGENDYLGPIRNDIINSPGDIDETGPLHNVTISEDEVDGEIVHGLMAAPHCPWRKGKTVISNLNGKMSGETLKKQKASCRKRTKAVAKKSTPKIQSSGLSFKKQNKVPISNDVDESPDDLMLADDGDHGLDGDFNKNAPGNHKPKSFEVNLPPFGPKSSGHGDARHKVRETLRFFHAIYRKLLQKEEANSKPEEDVKSRQSEKKSNRIDLLTVKILKEEQKLVNTDKVIGPRPGVEVGDEFQYRVELALVGIHFPYQSGIDSTKVNDIPLATSIVASGGYSDNLDDADVLIYSGQGGNVNKSQKTKQAEDQKLERGNLALKNCIAAKTPVRVVRGWKETKHVDPLDSKPKLVTTYIYDGLYTVKRCWTEKGPRGKQVFQFELKRNPGQPELAWKELRRSNKFKTRPGTCVTDISGGKELFPISAVNTLDDEKPPPFNYIQKMMHPDWFLQKPPAGCECIGRCSGSKKCICAVRYGGEIPYNRNGALVETKTLVYECGPHCKCPPACYNRVSQRGIKFKLEVFKTESRGWGVRPLTSIPSGSFICEYVGELLEDKEAEQRIGNDEYLFDIGYNVTDSSKPEEQEIATEITEEGGFTIDACKYGNVGRFINHSCSPNLHTQNVIYDHGDKRMPHIMLFAMENIPPLQELTYHYNYSVDQIRDSDGNIKVKKCYCGAAQCTGRMY